MTRARGSLTAVLVSLAACTAVAGAQTQAPASAQPSSRSERPFQLAPRVERTLPNGLRVIVVRQTVVPKVSLTLTVLSGYASDPADITGLAAMTADVIQEGTKTRSSRDVRQQAFAMGGTVSAAASQDYTSISARGLSEFATGLLDLVADVAQNPSFPDAEIAILKQQHMQAAARQNASPQFVSNREFRRALFGDHPYARVAESPQSVEKMTHENIAAFHRDHYRPNNALLLIVGDVDPKTMFPAVERAFGSWQRGDVTRPQFTAPPALKGRRVLFVQRPNSIQSSISIGNFAVRRSDPAWYDLTLANSIFGGAFNSRIVRNIREEKGYTYSPFSAMTAFADAGFYRFAGDVRNEVTGATISEVFKEIDKMRAEGSGGEELEGAKQYQRGLFAIQTATQTGLSNVLNAVYVFGLPADYPETYRTKIAAVSPAAVKAAAARLVASDDVVVVIVGDYAKVKDQLSAYKDITFVDVNGRKIPPPA